MSRLSFALLSVCAAALAGCPTTTPPPPDSDAGTAELVGRACNVDAECGPLRCDKIRRQCICLSDDSCRTADPSVVRYCNNFTGLCVNEIAGCKSAADCKDTQGNVDPTQYCDSSTRSCRALKSFCQECAADSECGGAEDNCVLDTQLNVKFCGRACGTVADCPRGAGCLDTDAGVKQCWPTPNPLTPNNKVSCHDFRGCTPDSLKTCNATAECGDSSQRCDPAKGKCVAVDQVCPFGTVCDPRNKICVAECVADPDCGDVKLRCVNRVCEPISECSKDTDCTPDKVCAIAPGQSVGECEPYCQSDSECVLGQVCQKQNDGRYRCVPGCTANATCPVDQRCSQASKVCEGPIVSGARICQTTLACGTCEQCNLTTFQCFPAKGLFPYCTPCSSPTECVGGACVLMDDGKTYCARYCTAGQECPQGFVCLPIGQGTQSACVPSNRQCAGKCP